MHREAEAQASEILGRSLAEEADPAPTANQDFPGGDTELPRADNELPKAIVVEAEAQPASSLADGLPAKDLPPALEKPFLGEDLSQSATGKTSNERDGQSIDGAGEENPTALEDVPLAELDKPKDPDSALPPLPGLQQLSLELPALNSLQLSNCRPEDDLPQQMDSEKEEPHLLHVVEFEDPSSSTELLRKEERRSPSKEVQFEGKLAGFRETLKTFQITADESSAQSTLPASAATLPTAVGASSSGGEATESGQLAAEEIAFKTEPKTADTASPSDGPPPTQAGSALGQGETQKEDRFQRQQCASFSTSSIRTTRQWAASICSTGARG